MRRIGNKKLTTMVTVLAVVFTTLLITAVSYRQVWVEDGTAGSGGGGINPDVTVVGDITLEDKDGNTIDDSYLADPTEDLVIYPKDENGDTITDEDLEWVWRPDGGSSDGSDDITLTPNPDGSITIPQEELEDGDGTIIVTDPEGGTDGSDATQEFPIEVLDPDTKSIQIVGKHYILINNSITLTAQYQHSSTPGTPTITSWSSSEENKADAATTNNGTIEGKALGKDIIITATSSEGKSDTHMVTVYKVSLEHKDGSGAIGDTVESGESITVIPKLEPSGVGAGDVELEYTWEPEAGGSGTVTITENPDGSITIEGGTVGDGTLVITDGSGNTQEQPLDVTPSASSKAITISGPKMVDIDFDQAPYVSSPTGVYGDYAKPIELTATSTGEAVVDLTGATWSWSPIDTDAEVNEESSTDGTATYKGVKPGTIEVTVEAVDGTTASYEVEVVESAFITFDLRGVAAESDGTYRLELPLVHRVGGGANYEHWEYEVDWGDGTAGSPNIKTLVSEDYDSETSSYPEHYYSENSTPKTIRIVNRDVAIGLQAWNFGYASVDRVGGRSAWGSRPFTKYGADELEDVKRYGSGKLGSGMFAYCENIVSFSAAGAPQLGENMYGMFAGAKGFNQDLSGWDVSGVKDMGWMFAYAKEYNNGLAPGVGGTLDWGDNTGLVENMGNMFLNAKGFNQDLSGWDVRGVKYMNGMFDGAEAYNNGLAPGVGGTLDWGDKTGLVEYMNGMFEGAKGFNQDLSGWDVRGVKNMRYMFSGAEAYNNGDAALDWGDNTGLVEDMSWMFYNAKGFNQEISGWDVSGVKRMDWMFYGAEAYNNGLASGVGGTLDWGDNTGLVENMNGMFMHAKAFNQEISGWDVSGVKYMYGMFEGAEEYKNGGESLNVDDNAGAHSSWDFEARAGETPSTKPDVTSMFTNSPMDTPAYGQLRPKGL